MKQRTAIIVQARMGSNRLPAKVLMDLAGATALARCLRRCRRVAGVDVVVCAVPADPANDPVALEAAAAGAIVTRGSETDVLARYADAARAVGATRVMRVTSDCPLIDPEICSEVIRMFDASEADYACNNLPPGWPHGLDCEIFPAELLFAAERAATRDDEREHVTPWMRTHPNLGKVNLAGPGGTLARHRWTLDHADDYRFLSAVFEHLVPHADRAGMTDVLAVLDRYPEIARINAHLVDHERLQARPATPVETGNTAEAPT